MTGVDLTRIDGVDAYTALKVVSEIGTAQVGEYRPLRFLAGAEPDNTGGKVISSKTKPSASRAAAASSANALHRSDSALGAFLRRKKAHLGVPQAITATAQAGQASTPCCGMARNTWMLARNTTNVDITSGRSAGKVACRHCRQDPQQFDDAVRQQIVGVLHRAPSQDAFSGSPTAVAGCSRTAAFSCSINCARKHPARFPQSQSGSPTSQPAPPALCGPTSQSRLALELDSPLVALGFGPP